LVSLQLRNIRKFTMRRTLGEEEYESWLPPVPQLQKEVA